MTGRSPSVANSASSVGVVLIGSMMGEGGDEDEGEVDESSDAAASSRIFASCVDAFLATGGTITLEVVLESCDGSRSGIVVGKRDWIEAEHGCGTDESSPAHRQKHPLTGHSMIVGGRAFPSPPPP